MSDFRQTLYDRYVSTFKTQQYQLDTQWLASYIRWCSYKYTPLLKVVDRNLPVLDLGCGPGYTLTYLKQAGFQYVSGIDISAEQIAIARQAKLDVQVGDAFSFLAQKQGEYGAILALDFIEHFTKDELLKLLPLIYQALRPDGVLLLQTVNGRGLFPNQIIYDDLTHMTILTPESLENLLNLHGFIHPVFVESGPVPSSLKGRVRLMLWSGIKLIANLIRMIETSKSQKLWTENMICACVKPL